MNIEERAEKWAAEHADEYNLPKYMWELATLLKEAYMAGVAQTQRDYVAHYEGRKR